MRGPAAGAMWGRAPGPGPDAHYIDSEYRYSVTEMLKQAIQLSDRVVIMCVVV